MDLTKWLLQGDKVNFTLMTMSKMILVSSKVLGVMVPYGKTGHRLIKKIDDKLIGDPKSKMITKSHKK